MVHIHGSGQPYLSAYTGHSSSLVAASNGSVLAQCIGRPTNKLLDWYNRVLAPHMIKVRRFGYQNLDGCYANQMLHVAGLARTIH
jgi:hypothetical protein